MRFIVLHHVYICEYSISWQVFKIRIFIIIQLSFLTLSIIVTFYKLSILLNVADFNYSIMFKLMYI